LHSEIAYKRIYYINHPYQRNPKRGLFMIKDGRFILEGMENVVINVGKITTEEELAEEEWEPMGPTPKPGILSLRNWDHRLLKDFPPFYAPICDMCCLCTYGKCDLTENRKGACGIGIEAQQARMVTTWSVHRCRGSDHTNRRRHQTKDPW
jgi:acetyl-CoA decarbonylase/synthase complex subunit alpha